MRDLGSILVGGLLATAACGAPAPAAPDEPVHGRCAYLNKFSQGPECRDYLGEWIAADAQKDCEDWGGAVELGARCDLSRILGRCLVTVSAGRLQVSFPGADASKCDTSRTGCEVFGGGQFVPARTCGGS